MRSRCRCSMCSAIHINSRSWLRSSSTHEPSDPPLKVFMCYIRFKGLHEARRYSSRDQRARTRRPKHSFCEAMKMGDKEKLDGGQPTSLSLAARAGALTLQFPRAGKSQSTGWSAQVPYKPLPSASSQSLTTISEATPLMLLKTREASRAPGAIGAALIEPDDPARS